MMRAEIEEKLMATLKALKAELPAFLGMLPPLTDPDVEACKAKLQMTMESLQSVMDDRSNLLGAMIIKGMMD
jgi:hypothetical protein